MKLPKDLLDGFGDRAAGVASAFGLHDLPEHGVVDVAAAVVADRAADVFGNAFRSRIKSSALLGLQFGMLFERGIQVFHVGRVMHVVMQVHRLLINDGFEGRVVIRQRG